jgi:hypothetical protein
MSLVIDQEDDEIGRLHVPCREILFGQAQLVNADRNGSNVVLRAGTEESLKTGV